VIHSLPSIQSGWAARASSKQQQQQKQQEAQPASPAEAASYANSNISTSRQAALASSISKQQAEAARGTPPT